MTTSQEQHTEQCQSLEPGLPPQETNDAMTEAPTAAKLNRPRHRWKPFVMPSLAILLLAAGTPYGLEQWQYYRVHESTDDAYVVGSIIPISARVGGTVLTVSVENHQQVEAGQILAQLDPQDFKRQVQEAEAAVAMAEADLNRAQMDAEWVRQSTESETAHAQAAIQEAQSDRQEDQHQIEAARAHLRTQQAVVTVAQADVESQNALLEIARGEFGRLEQLLTDGVVARQQFDEAAARFRAAQATLQSSQRKLTKARLDVERARIDLLNLRQRAISQAKAHAATIEAVRTNSQADQQKVGMKQVQVHMAEARLKQKQAALAQAQLRLAHATLRAPTAGVIAKSIPEVGQVVQPGQPLLSIVPLHDVWVEANYKETQLQRMKLGQTVKLKVDAYPGQMFHGTVKSISPGTGSVFSLLPPANATGNFVKVVQRVPVRIKLASQRSQDAVLRPGMSVIATVDLRQTLVEVLRGK